MFILTLDAPLCSKCQQCERCVYVIFNFTGSVVILISVTWKATNPRYNFFPPDNFIFMFQFIFHTMEWWAWVVYFQIASWWSCDCCKMLDAIFKQRNGLPNLRQCKFSFFLLNALQLLIEFTHTTSIHHGILGLKNSKKLVSLAFKSSFCSSFTAQSSQVQVTLLD